MPCPLDGERQVPLLTLGQAGFLATLDAAVLVDVTLQCFEIFIVKIRDVCAMFENLRHGLFFLLVFLFAFTALGSLFGLFRLLGFCLGDSLQVRTHDEETDNLVGDIQDALDLLHIRARDLKRVEHVHRAVMLLNLVGQLALAPVIDINDFCAVIREDFLHAACRLLQIYFQIGVEQNSNLVLVQDVLLWL